MPWSDVCQCHRPRFGPVPEVFFALKLGESQLDVGLNTHGDAKEGWEVDRPMPHDMDMHMSMDMMPERAASRYYSAAERTWLLDTLPRRVRHLGEPDHGYTLVVGRVGNQPHIFTYTLMPTSWGDTMVYGARYSRASFVSLLEGVLDANGLLPSTFTQGRRNRDVVGLRVTDHNGNLLFDSSPGIPADLAAHMDLPSRAGLLHLDAAIRPELAGKLLIGGLPRSRLPFLLGLLGLAAALSIVAVTQLRREGELAQIRADFVSSVSHELRTPLAQIRLYLETLQLGRVSTEEQRQWSLGHIERETTRLSHLVENVLRFSTLAHGQTSSRMLVDIAAATAVIVDEFRPLAASRRATILLDASDAPLVALEADALRHILLNLLDNAVKYGPPGQTVQVYVRGDAVAASIVVDDQGPGVSEHERETIWRAFTRGGAATSTGGSGIGLTVVRDVVEAHGGTVGVESAPTGGARFVVLLPAASASA
jgi:signal transduction histidine kinase